jgi:hypothetical protein
VAQLAPVDKAGRVDPEDPAGKAVRAIDLRAAPVSAIHPQRDRVGKLVRAIGLRAVPTAALLPPVDRADRLQRAENAGQAVQEAQVVRVDLVAVDLDLHPSL